MTRISIKRPSDRFALWFGRILSWSAWLPLILAGSIAGLVLRQEDLVMLLLTIQTSVDAAATKMLQNHLRGEDEEREERTDKLLLELQKQARAAVKRDKTMLAAITATNELLDYIVKGGLRDEKRRTSGARKTNGRAARTKPKN